MPSLFSAMKDVVLNLLGAPKLLYQVEFSHNGPHVNYFEIPPPTWVVGTSSVPGQEEQPLAGPLQTITDEWLRLRITRAANVASGSTPTVQCLIPLPLDLRIFTLRARFRWLSFRDSPMKPGDQWAGMLLATDASPLEQIDPPDATVPTNVVGATHQFRDDTTDQLDLCAQLGLARGTTDPSTPGVKVPMAEAYPASGGTGLDREFLLETDIDTTDGRGWSRLRTPGFTWAQRGFTHPYRAAADQPTGITGVGVGIAIANGTGTAHMEVCSFELYSRKRVPIWWRPVANRLAEFR